MFIVFHILMRPLRIIFDSNIFSVDNFGALDYALFRKLYANRRVMPIYTAVILEEVLQTYSLESKRTQLLDRWLPFIIETAPKFCLELPKIWHQELVQKKGCHANIFMDAMRRKKTLQYLKKLPRDGSCPLINIIQPLRDEIASEKKISRQDSIERRNNFDANDPWLIEIFSADHERLEEFGIGIIERRFPTQNHRAISSRWLRDPCRYPYFTQFVKNCMFRHSYPSIDKSAPIDKNAQADLDILTHLLYADVLVSNEKKFMKYAFDKLWLPRKKVMFTSNEFAEFLRKL
jgi:hypothetical protein